MADSGPPPFVVDSDGGMAYHIAGGCISSQIAASGLIIGRDAMSADADLAEATSGECAGGEAASGGGRRKDGLWSGLANVWTRYRFSCGERHTAYDRLS